MFMTKKALYHDCPRVEGENKMIDFFDCEQKFGSRFSEQKI